MKVNTLLMLIASVSALQLAKDDAPSAATQLKEAGIERKRELAMTLDSLAQAEKELGMKLDPPPKVKKVKYEGIGAKSAMADAGIHDEEEDNESTMASL